MWSRACHAGLTEFLQTHFLSLKVPVRLLEWAQSQVTVFEDLGWGEILETMYKGRAKQIQF